MSKAPDMVIVGIRIVIGQAHVIPSRERQLIVNHGIDLGCLMIYIKLFDRIGYLAV